MNNASSMFDGLQIFGKTDSKFSMTQSLQIPSKSNSKPVANYDFQNDNNSVLLPPTQFSSLPTSSKSSLNYEIPSKNHNVEHDPIDLMIKSEVLSHNKHPQDLPKTWKSQGKSPALKFTPKVDTASKADLAPLQEVKFYKEPLSRKSPICHSPPPLSSPEPPHEVDQPDRITNFFNQASVDLSSFQEKLASLNEKHEKTFDCSKSEIETFESSIKSVSLSVIYDLIKHEEKSKSVLELEIAMNDAIKSEDYEVAQNIQAQIDQMKSSLSSKLFKFEQPSQLKLIQEDLQNLNGSRKTCVEGLKTFCVELDEQSNKLTSITKKIEVQCSSKMEKKKQAFSAIQNELDCREEHLKIDQDFYEKQFNALNQEIKVVQTDFELQMNYQNELLTTVQSEIKDLEERLIFLRSEEQIILNEKEKIKSEKIENEQAQQRKSNELQKNKDSIDVKNVSIGHAKTTLNNERVEFEKNYSKLENISQQCEKISKNLTSWKSCTCDSISVNEDLIVNEVQVSINSGVKEILEIPDTLLAQIEKLAKCEESHKQTCDIIFDLQRQLTELKSQKSLAESELNNCTSLKQHAVKNKRYHQAAEINRKESDLQAQIESFDHKFSEVSAEHSKHQAEADVLCTELDKANRDATKEQLKFDLDCHKIILQKLEDSVTILAANKPGVESVSKNLLEYDICYMYFYLKAIKYRNPELINENAAVLQQITPILDKIRNELEFYKKESATLKLKIDSALDEEDFSKADLLNKKYELFHVFNT